MTRLDEIVEDVTGMINAGFDHPEFNRMLRIHPLTKSAHCLLARIRAGRHRQTRSPPLRP